MVGVNLYKRKKVKLKITTFLLLCAILILPVAAFRITLNTMREMEISSIRAESPHASRFLTGAIQDLGSAAQQLNQESTLMNQRIRNLQAGSRELENNVLYQVKVQNALEQFLESIHAFPHSRIYINAISIARGRDLKLDFFEAAPTDDQHPSGALETHIRQNLQPLGARIVHTASDSLFFKGKYLQITVPLAGM